MLGEPDLGHGGLIELGGWDDASARPRSAEEVIHALEMSWTIVETAMKRWTAEDLSADVATIDWRGTPLRLRRTGVVANLMTHDAHHGSEISVILRAHGLSTALNR